MNIQYASFYPYINRPFAHEGICSRLEAISSRSCSVGYTFHPDIETPPMETVIWRYIDLPKFLQMLAKGGLYFATLSEFSDKWEAVLGRELTQSIATHFGGASGDVIQLFQEYSKHTAVNCWYQGDGESIAMWELYTTTEYGVAIKSTVGNLTHFFHAEAKACLAISAGLTR